MVPFSRSLYPNKQKTFRDGFETNARIPLGTDVDGPALRFEPVHSCPIHQTKALIFYLHNARFSFAGDVSSIKKRSFKIAIVDAGVKFEVRAHRFWFVVPFLSANLLNYVRACLETRART